MNYTIIDMNHRLEFLDENKKKRVYNAYAFMDKSGHYIIIVYGEKKRDLMSEYLCETLPSSKG
jgi:hypothetical protein